MLSRRIVGANTLSLTKRFISSESKKDGKRFMQTIRQSVPKNNFYSELNYSINKRRDSGSANSDGKWAKHSLSSGPTEESTSMDNKETTRYPIRRSRTSKFSNNSLKQLQDDVAKKPLQEEKNAASVTVAREPEIKQVDESKTTTPAVNTKPKKRRTLKPRKALITLTPNAIDHLRGLMNQPTPQLIRIGVQNRGCSGLTYNLEYVSEPGKFDELIEQDGVRILIDSKALFSIVGSEMDWLDDKLSSRFVFKNPNSKGTCGCGESFMV